MSKAARVHKFMFVPVSIVQSFMGLKIHKGGGGTPITEGFHKKVPITLVNTITRPRLVG